MFLRDLSLTLVSSHQYPVYSIVQYPLEDNGEPKQLLVAKCRPEMNRT